MELLHVLLLMLFSAVAGAALLVLAIVGLAGGFSALLGRALDRAEVPPVLDTGAGEPAREAEIERNFRLSGGYGPPGRTQPAGELPQPRPAPSCGPCAFVRGQLKKISPFFK